MRKTRLATAAVSLVGLAALLLGPSGCSSTGPLQLPSVTLPSLSRMFSLRPVATNPLVVPSTDFDLIWNKSVAVVDKYFDIAEENRLSRKIVTQPQAGATLIEPWSWDSVTFTDRFESTLQTIRRFAIIQIDPGPTGGYLVKVEVHKELEDMVKPDRQMAGRAVFNNTFPVNRTREIVGPVPAPLGWINRGRDSHLEQVILAGIRDALFL
ncbi:MAG: hypothetical protein ACP5XB_05700 [Isosphaeraceae bacterium]